MSTRKEPSCLFTIFVLYAGIQIFYSAGQIISTILCGMDVVAYGHYPDNFHPCDAKWLGIHAFLIIFLLGVGILAYPNGQYGDEWDDDDDDDYTKYDDDGYPIYH